MRCGKPRKRRLRNHVVGARAVAPAHELRNSEGGIDDAEPHKATFSYTGLTDHMLEPAGRISEHKWNLAKSNMAPMTTQSSPDERINGMHVVNYTTESTRGVWKHRSGAGHE
jgi:hypothetical protein